MIDIKNLETELEKLTGTDFLQAEKETRAGNTDFIGVLQLSPKFQLNIAARALNVNPHELENLPLKKFSKILTVTSNFLFSDLAEETTPAD